MTVWSSALFEGGNEISKKLSGGGSGVQNLSQSMGETSSCDYLGSGNPCYLCT